MPHHFNYNSTSDGVPWQSGPHNVAHVLYSQSVPGPFGSVCLSQVGRVRDKRGSHSNGSHQSSRHESEPQSIIVYQSSAELDIRRKRAQGLYRVSNLINDLNKKERKMLRQWSFTS